MKFVKYMFCIIALSLLATACSPQNPADVDTTGSNAPQPEADFMPMCFDSEEQLLGVIDEVKSKKNAEDNTVVVKSKTAGEQQYSAKSDKLKLASISEFYKPNDKLNGSSLKEIHVKNEYVSYWYANEDQIVCATFTWLREMPPDVAMSGLSDRGATSVQEIERNGIKYVFLEWTDPETDKSTGYSVYWVNDGKAYQASVLVGYSVDEILKFCKLVTVHVK